MNAQICCFEFSCRYLEMQLQDLECLEDKYGLNKCWVIRYLNYIRHCGCYHKKRLKTNLDLKGFQRVQIRKKFCTATILVKVDLLSKFEASQWWAQLRLDSADLLGISSEKGVPSRTLRAKMSLPRKKRVKGINT